MINTVSIETYNKLYRYLVFISLIFLISFGLFILFCRWYRLLGIQPDILSVSSGLLACVTLSLILGTVIILVYSLILYAILNLICSAVYNWDISHNAVGEYNNITNSWDYCVTFTITGGSYNVPPRINKAVRFIIEDLYFPFQLIDYCMLHSMCKSIKR